MIEGLINIMAPAGEANETNETLDGVALAGAEAIQRIIADRNNLRLCTSAQQRDLVALNSANEDLRRRLALFRHHYVELATKILAQLEQFDQATRDVMRDQGQGAQGGTGGDDNLAALVHRLKPLNGAAKPAAEGKPEAR